MLTSLEPPSPTSSAKPHGPESSLQTTLRLPEHLPIISPPQSHPAKYRDATQSSRVPPVVERLWARFRKTNKDQALQPPDQLSTTSGQPVNLPADSQSKLTANIANKGPSLMAATQRVRVSVFFGRREVCGTSHKASQRVVAVRIHPVRCSVCSLAPLFILRDSET